MINFIKMHGIGNDFVILDARQGIKFNAKIAKELSDRKTGVGCDQVILIQDSSIGCDFKVLFFNADGSRAEACGNGTRCVSKLMMKEKNKTFLSIESEAGILKSWINKSDKLITVNMGTPKFCWNEIPLAKKINAQEVDLGEVSPGKAFCLSMGNPHAVIFVKNLDNHSLENFGSKLENHSLFSKKANISLAEIINKERIKIKVWERGVGMTNACGSAACAAVVAGNKQNNLSNICEVNLDGGILFVEITKENQVNLKGPSEVSFKGFLSKRLEDLF